MAKFKITAPDGRSLVLTGDSPPSQEELEQIFAQETGGPQPFTGSIAGGPLAFAGGGKQPEEALPMTGQILGGAFGGLPGAVAGATAGEAGRQFIKGNVSPKRLGQEALRTGITEGVFRGLGKVATPAAKKLASSAIKFGRRSLERRPKLGLEAARAGLSGTKNQIQKKSIKLIENNESKLQDVLSKSKAKVNISDLSSSLDDLERQATSIGDDASLKAVSQIKENLKAKGTLSLQEANQFKRDLTKSVRDTQFGTSEVPAKIEARKTIASKLKEAIENASGSKEVKELNRKIGLGIETETAISKQIAQREGSNILPFFEASGAATALSFGRPEIAALIAGRRVLGSTPVKTGLAKALVSPTTRAVGRGARLATSEAGRQLSQ